MNAAAELARSVGAATACQALSVPRASFYRWRLPPVERSAAPRKPAPRSLSPEERQQVLQLLHSPRFVDQPPTQIVAAKLDEGEYLCSARTMYRFLKQEHEVRERRNQLRHPHYAKPELLATGPNQVWSWDISVPQKRRERWEFGLPQSACRSRLQTTMSGFG